MVSAAASLSAMTPVSSMSANTACAGFIASVWSTSSTPLPRRTGTVQATVRDLIWTFYRDLKTYRYAPTKQRNAALRARFDRIFKRKTGVVTLDRLLVRLNASESELLMVLDRPEIPLHTNGSENDVRCHARLVPAPAATSVVTAAMPSSASPKPAPQARNRILGLPAIDSPSQPQRPFHACPKSFSPEPSHPDRHGFCPSYRNTR